MKEVLCEIYWCFKTISFAKFILNKIRMKKKKYLSARLVESAFLASFRRWETRTSRMALDIQHKCVHGC